MTVNKEPSPLKGILGQILSSLGRKGEFDGWRMVELWPEIVGPEIARYARAVRFIEGSIIVVIEKDAWRQELEMQREHILRKIWSFPGGTAVRKIVLRAGSNWEKENEQDNG